jgi:hypothetical protein
VVHEAEENSIIDAEVAAKVEAVATSIINAEVAAEFAFAEMVIKSTVNVAIVGTLEVVNDNPNNVANDSNNDGKGEGVPVAKVVYENSCIQ